MRLRVEEQSASDSPPLSLTDLGTVVFAALPLATMRTKGLVGGVLLRTAQPRAAAILEDHTRWAGPKRKRHRS